MCIREAGAQLGDLQLGTKERFKGSWNLVPIAREILNWDTMQCLAKVDVLKKKINRMSSCAVV